MGKTIGIIVIVIVALALLYLGYKYFFGNQDKAVASASTSNTNAANTNAPSGPFNPGDNVYVTPLRSTYMYVYSYPNNNSANEVGRTTNALSGPNSIGQYVAMSADGRFVRVKFNSIIERRRENPNRPGAYFYTNEHATGDYFVPSDKVQNKPY